MGTHFSNSPSTAINFKIDQNRLISATLQGWPKDQQDFVTVSLKNNTGFCILAVFDGYGGPAISQYLSLNIEKWLDDQFHVSSDPSTALVETIKKLDKFCCSSMGIKSIILNSKKYNMGEQDHEIVGSTISVVLIGKKKIYSASLGNSRIVIVDKQQQVINLSYDHSPIAPLQKQRLNKLNVPIIYGMIQGKIQCSRSIGHRQLKSKKIMLNIPYVVEKKIENIKFLLMASAGIWECKSQQQIVQRFQYPKQNYLQQMKKLFFDCLAPSPYCSKTGVKNMSMILYRFN